MKELGEYLKAERSRLGVDLATITQQTCISKSMLTALEEGDSDKIETPLLVRSFARAYCRVLGLDPTAVLEKYTGETPRHERLDEGIRRYRERSLAVRERARLKLFFLVFTLATVVGVYITTVWLPKKEQAQLLQMAQQAFDETPSAPVEPPQVERSTPVTREPASNTATAPTAGGETQGKTGVMDRAEPMAEATRQPGEVRATVPKESAMAESVGASAPAAQGYHLRVEALVETWVEVRLDDKKVEGVLLPAGETRDWDVQKGVRLLIGNATGVKVLWNGKPLKNLGKAGKVARLRLPEEATKR